MESNTKVFIRGVYMWIITEILLYVMFSIDRHTFNIRILGADYILMSVLMGALLFVLFQHISIIIAEYKDIKEYEKFKKQNKYEN